MLPLKSSLPSSESKNSHPPKHQFLRNSFPQQKGGGHYVTSRILEANLQYISSILQPIELKKKKYTSNLYYFDKRSTFDVHLVKLNHHFTCILCIVARILQVYFTKKSWPLFWAHVSQWTTLCDRVQLPEGCRVTMRTYL